MEKSTNSQSAMFLEKSCRSRNTDCIDQVQVVCQSKDNDFKE